MTDEVLPVLESFYREIMYPDMKRLVVESVELMERHLRDDMHALFDPLLERLDRLTGS